MRKDLNRKKTITLTLIIFIMLSSILVSTGSSMISKLYHSIDHLFTNSKTPHFVQMHAGDLDQAALENWAQSHDLVKDYQLVEMVNIDGANIIIGKNSEPETNSVMDISFVKQNGRFDYLLTLENNIAYVSPGAVGVPIYYLQRNDLKLGDTLVVSNGSLQMSFTITHFVRDSLMNPSVVHSKRFLLHENDYETMKNTFGEIEYLIEFLLTDLSKRNTFIQQYEAASLPNSGPTIDYQAFQLLNALSDGIVAVVIILVSFLLIVIASLCLRLTILSTLEEDYQEIGVMKAIGLHEHFIRNAYLIKYIFIAGLASLLGYFISLFTSQLLTSNIVLYSGSPEGDILSYIISFFGAMIVFLIIVLFCRFTLRRFQKVSAVEALRTGHLGDTKLIKRFSLKKTRLLDVNSFLGINDIFSRLKMFILLCVVFIICSIVIIVPVNFYHTIQSPHFISYMGIGKSDIRIDLQKSEDILERFNKVVSYLETDPDVDTYSPLITSRFQVRNSAGVFENISVETGNLSIFPLEYLEGRAPMNEQEIVLSYINANDLEKSVGDSLLLQLNSDGSEKEVVVTGIYQDITNGGRTAKAIFSPNYESVLWYVVSLDLKDDIAISKKLTEYTKEFYPSKVTYIQEYLSQTLGDTVQQVRILTMAAIVIGLAISILITTLFVKMVIAKDAAQIAIKRCIGFSVKDIQLQYVVGMSFLMIVGIMVGTFLANVGGERIVSVFLSSMGISRLEFTIHPIRAYIVCPFILISSVVVTTILSTGSIEKIKLSHVNND
ncbi:ABC transporter permease [Caldalkalibacillus mannanilyticus]|uniref:ABC transporter permease n=1 Tax=Caldalkalibacillus mannanilyticus TaxID=1418 RepID=UPI001F34948F|nr:FtsX-like permease family protein [Caldalkalibacillus mannanilyticus]